MIFLEYLIDAIERQRNVSLFDDLLHLLWVVLSAPIDESANCQAMIGAWFIEDVIEDLKEIDQSRIAGLGITQDQLKNWLVTSSGL